jgi:hypothetical protein
MFALLRLLRFAAAVVLAAMVMNAVGIALAADLPCAQRCDDDGPDGQCAPTCQDCLCCAHARVAFVAPTAVFTPGEARAIRSLAPDGQPPEAATQDIFRVPKAAA